MHRFYLPGAGRMGPTLTLTDSEAHHALHVLRVRRGERLTVLDGEGNQFICDIREADRRTLTLAVVERKHIPPLPCAVTLAKAVTKGKSMDLAVQKAAELGVHRFVPLICERTVSQVDNEGALAKVEKWQAIAIESIKQCGSAWLPQIDAPLPLQKFAAESGSFELSLVGALTPDATHPRVHFELFRAKHGRNPASICLWVGPEGDFTEGEMELMKSKSVIPVSLGRLVLRSETAAIYLTSITNYEVQG
ncbi:MAG: 16S rRNA (uracil(1498)-N(3))-methyltransferase [Pedosphaera sp.]|nr:16S rRNA (uracil(1498)-N(3))-methyltransferase [Pedosphaera sp.]